MSMKCLTRCPAIRIITLVQGITGPRALPLGPGKGGGIAKKARLELGQKTGRLVVSGSNFLPPKKQGITKGKKK